MLCAWKGMLFAQQVGEDPAAEVVELPGRDVGEDLRLEDVDAAVAQAGARLLLGGLLLEADDPVVVVGHHHAVEAGIGHLLDGQVAMDPWRR